MTAMLRSRFSLLALLALLVCVACFAACRTEPASARGPQVVRTIQGSLLIAESGPDTGVGITAELRQREVICSRRDRDAAPLGYIVFERRGERMAYGVYGLGLAKNPMGSGRPLDGDAIAWPDRDHAQGLAYLLERTMPAAEAEALVARNRAHWFRPGLRVFFVMPGAPEDAAQVGGVPQPNAALRIATLE